MMHGLQFWLEAHYTETSLGRVDTDKNGISDAWEDSDGDGAFNIQELMIGKNPANPHDVLGIHLRIGLNFSASKDFVDKLIMAIRLASKYMYDYTDGHVFISFIEIYNSADICFPVKIGNRIVLYPEHDGFDVRIQLHTLSAKINGGEYKQSSFIGFALMGYGPGVIVSEGVWINGSMLETPPRLHPEWDDWQRIRWLAAIIGHEVGHYKLKFFDEYFDRNWVFYYHGIGDDLWEKYKITTVYHLGNPSVIEGYEEIDLKELSTYEAYQKFFELWQHYKEEGYDQTMWETHQWYVWTTYMYLNYGFAWYTLIYMLTHTCSITPTLWFGNNIYVFTNIHDILLSYRPLPGPYTLVSDYLYWVMY